MRGRRNQWPLGSHPHAAGSCAAPCPHRAFEPRTSSRPSCRSPITAVGSCSLLGCRTALAPGPAVVSAGRPATGSPRKRGREKGWGSYLRGGARGKRRRPPLPPTNLRAKKERAGWWGGREMQGERRVRVRVGWVDDAVGWRELQWMKRSGPNWWKDVRSGWNPRPCQRAKHLAGPSGKLLWRRSGLCT
jgi:hypothetical protein